MPTGKIPKENRRSLKDRVWYIGQGDFIEKYMTPWTLKLIVSIIIYMLFSVYNNFSGIRNLKKINALKRELTELRLEKASLSSTLMGEGRMSVIEERVQKEELEISIPKNPPIILEK